MNWRPSISGTWYPADAAELRRKLEALIQAVPIPSPTGMAKVRGLLVPHAGLAYSGGVAAHAYTALKDLTYDVVVILGPYHAYHESPFLVCQQDGYSTPLGPVPVDRRLIGRVDACLRTESGMGLAPTPESTEHSIEIQLPFLQTIQGTFRLLPIMLAHQTPAAVDALASALAFALKDLDCLVIASSDLSHFNPQHLAMLLDREMLRRIESFQAEAVLGAEREGAGSACGVGAIAAMLQVADAFGASNAKILSYRTSGDVTGDFDSVIGYAAGVFW